MFISTLLTSLPAPFEHALGQVADLGFTHVDIVGLAERPTSHCEALADSGLLVSCAAVGRGLPDNHTLDAVSADARRAAVAEIKRQIVDAAQLGATHCYVVSGMDSTGAGLARFGEACCLLADFAGQRQMRFCVEHIPGRALATAATTLEWLEKLAHANLSLLFDVGHCLITAEDAADVVRRAGPRLGYVHFDDNDGTGDLHWPLLTGRLTRKALEGVLAALRQIDYQGALCLELNSANAHPEVALREGKRLLEGKASV